MMTKTAMGAYDAYEQRQCVNTLPHPGHLWPGPEKMWLCNGVALYVSPAATTTTATGVALGFTTEASAGYFNPSHVEIGERENTQAETVSLIKKSFVHLMTLIERLEDQPELSAVQAERDAALMQIEQIIENCDRIVRMPGRAEGILLGLSVMLSRYGSVSPEHFASLTDAWLASSSGAQVAMVELWQWAMRTLPTDSHIMANLRATGLIE